MQIRKGNTANLYQFQTKSWMTSVNYYFWGNNFGKKNWGKEIIKMLNLK